MSRAGSEAGPARHLLSTGAGSCQPTRRGRRRAPRRRRLKRIPHALRSEIIFLMSTSARVWLFTVLLAPVGKAQPASAIDQFISRYHELGLFNGSALIADHGQVVIKKGYGLANMEWNIPNAPDTKFRLGSVTKQFTATLILQLVEQGKIDLHAPVTRYLPDYPARTGDKITIHNLLNHTSGIPGYTETPGFGEKMRDSYKPVDFIKMFSGLDLFFEAGNALQLQQLGLFFTGGDS